MLIILTHVLCYIGTVNVLWINVFPYNVWGNETIHTINMTYAQAGFINTHTIFAPAVAIGIY